MLASVSAVPHIDARLRPAFDEAQGLEHAQHLAHGRPACTDRSPPAPARREAAWPACRAPVDVREQRLHQASCLLSPVARCAPVADAAINRLDEPVCSTRYGVKLVRPVVNWSSRSHRQRRKLEMAPLPELSRRQRRRLLRPPADQPAQTRAGRSGGHQPRRGRLHLRRCRRALHRDGRGAVVRIARFFRQRAHRAGRLRPDAQARLLPHLPAPRARGQHRSGREADPACARADVEGAVPVLGLGSQRHGHQARLVLSGGHGPAGQEQDHRPPGRLSRQYGCLGQRLGQARHARRFRLCLCR